MIPNNATSSTAAVSGLVYQEIVRLPLYILQQYQTPLVVLAIIFAIFGAVFGFLKLIGEL